MGWENIIKMLETGVKWEDEFVLRYDGEVVRGLIETIDPGKSERIIKLLDENISDTKRHSSEIKEILEKIRRGDYGE